MTHVAPPSQRKLDEYNTATVEGLKNFLTEVVLHNGFQNLDTILKSISDLPTTEVLQEVTSTMQQHKIPCAFITNCPLKRTIGSVQRTIRLFVYDRFYLDQVLTNLGKEKQRQASTLQKLENKPEGERDLVLINKTKDLLSTAQNTYAYYAKLNSLPVVSAGSGFFAISTDNLKNFVI